MNCKEKRNKADINMLPKSPVPLHQKEIKYINALSGLNYRKQPNEQILGKFEYNEKVEIVKHTQIFIEINDDDHLIKGEWVGVLNKKDTVYVFDGFLSTNKNKVFTNVWDKFPLRKMPLIDSTNFDNIKKTNKLTYNDIKELQLQELYPDLLKDDSYYEAYPSYKLNIGNFKSIVTAIFKGEHELESVLIIYNQDDKLSKIYQGDNEEPSINSLVISYDEIAEGWSRTTSKIKNNCITTIDALYTEPPVIDTLLHHINNEGYINKVNTNFKNNIRYNKSIKLHTTYTDTIQFIKYNDDYDYFFIEGKKNNKNVSLIYNWDVIDTYDFKENDFIKIKWKMDSMHIAGDGETLSFSEFAIDAEKIK